MMDENTFDRIARGLAAAHGRRSLLRSLAAAVGGLLAERTADRAAANKGGPPPDHGHCRHPNAACARHDDCCSGVCCADALKGQTVCCDAGEACVTRVIDPSRGPQSFCCRPEGLCEVVPGEFICCGPGESCQPGYNCCPPGTQLLGGACASDAECCLGRCNGGVCVCQAVGDACGPRDNQGLACCSLTCGDAAAPDHCACSSISSPCYHDADCCAGRCEGYRCVDCGLAGTTCAADGDCCSGSCGDGLCLALACGVAGAPCASTADCCTGSACLQGRCGPLQLPG